MAFYRKFDLSAMNGIEEILVKQQDANSRTVIFELEDEGVPFDLSQKTVTFFAKRKCDGKVFASECTVDSNLATVVLSGNMLSENDILMCELTIIGEDYTISTPTFTVNVAELVRNDDYIEGTDEFSAFEIAMQNAMQLPDANIVNQAVERLEAALEALDSNTLPDDSVGISKTKFFDYDYFVTSSNIFNGVFERDTILSTAAGVVSSNAQYSTSDYIEVEPAKTYILSRTDLNCFNNNVVVCWYNADKKYLSSQAVYTSPENRIITAPNLAEYMRFSMLTNELDTAEHIVVVGVDSEDSLTDNYIPEYEEYTLGRIASISDTELLAMFEERDNCSVAAANDYTDLCFSMEINGSKITDMTITSSKLADGAVTADKLADGLMTKGDDGVGVESVVQTYISYEDNGENTITVYLTDGKSFSFKIKNGSKGSKGEKGQKGDKGDRGLTGAAGENGFSPTVTVAEITGGHRVYIVDKNGQSQFDVMDGKDAEIAVDDLNPVTYSGDEISILQKGICIGDSMTIGLFDYNDGNGVGGNISDAALCYPAILKRITGMDDILIAGQSGFTISRWYNYVVTSASSFSGIGLRFVIIFLGICDGNQNGWTEESAANYTNIVNKFREDIQNVKLFAVTPPKYFSGELHDAVADGIREKAEELGLHLIDLRKDWTDCTAENWQNYGVAQGSHFHSWGQYQLAKVLKSYISYIIKNNPDEFNDIQFVGNDYSYTN